MTVSEFRDTMLRWFQQNGRRFPWRQSDLEPAMGLITELLLRKTTAEQVNKVYASITLHLKVFLESGHCPAELAEALRPLGLYQQRMEAIQEIVEFLQTRYGGKLPQELGQLLEIPHIGPYAANATRCFYLEQPVPIVDTNIARLLGRLFGISGNTSNPIRTRIYWLVAAALVPKQRAKEFNWSLLDLGALVCTPLRPKCASCPVSAVCEYVGNFSEWCGLSNIEKQELKKFMWDSSLIPLRLAELAGLSSVPSATRVYRLLKQYSRDIAWHGNISELDLRKLVFSCYCNEGMVGQVGWVFGFKEAVTSKDTFET